MPAHISTRRHLEYARGYLGLGMLKDAAAELSRIEPGAQQSTEVLRVRVDLFMETKEWDAVIATAERVCTAAPGEEGAWIAWAYALRELNRVHEAEEILLRAEPLHGKTCAVLHYNLACYACLLGNQEQARIRLLRAFKMEEDWRSAALTDPDLKDLWAEIPSLQ